MWSFIAIRIGKQGTGIFILRLLAKFTGLIPRSHLHGLKITWIVGKHSLPIVAYWRYISLLEMKSATFHPKKILLISYREEYDHLPYKTDSFVEWSYNLLRLQWMAPLTTITNEIIRASIFILTTQRFP